jgi:3-deoxy-D-manno-octulosonic-acid transferase
LWPNFVALAKQRARVAVVNGRISPRSYRGYSRIKTLMRYVFGHVDLLAMQSEEYADRITNLGAPPPRVVVTGSVKYDGVTMDRGNAKTRALAETLGWTGENGKRLQDPVWIVGSTQAPEEAIAIDIYRRAVNRFPRLRLLLVPRHKERFDEVAELLSRSGLPFLRRSQLSAVTGPGGDASVVPIILLDTLGELGAAWGLADVAFVGGSLTPRGGQNMIEPAAYGAAVTFGPNVWNFQETVDRLLARGGAVQVRDAAELEGETLRLLADTEARETLGNHARAFVQSQQGAAERTLQLLDGLIETQPLLARAA